MNVSCNFFTGKVSPVCAESKWITSASEKQRKKYYNFVLLSKLSPKFPLGNKSWSIYQEHWHKRSAWWFNQRDKVRAHKGGMGIGKTPKNLDSICCPQHRETEADTLKQLRPIGEGDQELEKRLDQEELTRRQHTCTGNQCESTPCTAILISTSKNPWSFLLLFILSLQQN
jgi:hypothetical protein